MEENNTQSTPDAEQISSVASEQNFENYVTDDFDVKYSSDGSRLIKAPDNSNNIKEYIIKPGTIEICAEAFLGCESLERVTIPESVRWIAKRAFSGCINLSSVTIGDSVEEIGSYAFSECTGLRSVSFGKSCTSIRRGAFFRCLMLTDINFGSVGEIGEEAFRECESLERVTIPESVTTIADSAFQNCDNLKTIYIPVGSRERFAQQVPELSSLLVEQQA